MTIHPKHPIAPDPIAHGPIEDHEPHRTSGSRRPEHRGTEQLRRVVDVPLALWPVGQVSPQCQRAGRYDPASSAHPGKMLPALAARIVAEYSTPGDCVLDPLVGIGTTLVEAAAAGRRAIGVELEPRWAALAESNCDRVLDAEHRSLAEVIVGDARHLERLLGPTYGQVDLVCTSPPYARDVGQIGVTRDGGARRRLREVAIAEVYAACFGALREGGLLVTVTKNTLRKGRTLDLAAATVALCESVGFTYVGHVVALHAAVRDSDLVGRPSFWQAAQARKARTRGEPASVVVHEDVCCFSRGTARLGGVRRAVGSAVRDGK